MIPGRRGAPQLRAFRVGFVCVALFGAVVAVADVPIESIGRVETLPVRSAPHWIWVGDLVLARTALFDADDGSMLGMLSAGTGVIQPDFAADHREIYLAETHYARRTRGERSDVVTVYDTATLAAVAEVAIPPKRAEHVSGAACSALSDDDRFLAIFNLTPATSLSIVDTRERRFAGEIATPGCSLVYAAGARRFIMVCANGELLLVTLDERGAERSKARFGPFFDPEGDPVTEKATRHGDTWLFASFEGWIHPVDVSGEAPAFPERWSLLTLDDRVEQWRVGGAQHLAAHERSGRLYSLVHQGGPDTHKQAGTEVWVYDLAARQRIQRIEVVNPTALFVARMLEIAPDGALADVIGWAMPNSGVDRIAVTQDAEPLLLMAGGVPVSLGVYDARTGEFLRDVPDVGFFGGALQVP